MYVLKLNLQQFKPRVTIDKVDKEFIIITNKLN